MIKIQLSVTFFLLFVVLFCQVEVSICHSQAIRLRHYVADGEDHFLIKRSYKTGSSYTGDLDDDGWETDADEDEYESNSQSLSIENYEDEDYNEQDYPESNPQYLDVGDYEDEDYNEQDYPESNPQDLDIGDYEDEDYNEQDYPESNPQDLDIGDYEDEDYDKQDYPESNPQDLDIGDYEDEDYNEQDYSKSNPQDLGVEDYEDEDYNEQDYSESNPQDLSVEGYENEDYGEKEISESNPQNLDIEDYEDEDYNEQDYSESNPQDLGVEDYEDEDYDEKESNAQYLDVEDNEDYEPLEKTGAPNIDVPNEDDYKTDQLKDYLYKIYKKQTSKRDWKDKEQFNDGTRAAYESNGNSNTWNGYSFDHPDETEVQGNDLNQKVPNSKPKHLLHHKDSNDLALHPVHTKSERINDDVENKPIESIFKAKEHISGDQSNRKDDTFQKEFEEYLMHKNDYKLNENGLIKPENESSTFDKDNKYENTSEAKSILGERNFEEGNYDGDYQNGADYDGDYTENTQPDGLGDHNYPSRIRENMENRFKRSDESADERRYILRNKIKNRLWNRETQNERNPNEIGENKEKDKTIDKNKAKENNNDKTAKTNEDTQKNREKNKLKEKDENKTGIKQDAENEIDSDKSQIKSNSKKWETVNNKEGQKDKIKDKVADKTEEKLIDLHIDQIMEEEKELNKATMERKHDLKMKDISNHHRMNHLAEKKENHKIKMEPKPINGHKLMHNSDRDNKANHFVNSQKIGSKVSRKLVDNHSGKCRTPIRLPRYRTFAKNGNRTVLDMGWNGHQRTVRFRKLDGATKGKNNRFALELRFHRPALITGLVFGGGKQQMESTDKKKLKSTITQVIVKSRGRQSRKWRTINQKGKRNNIMDIDQENGTLYFSQPLKAKAIRIYPEDWRTRYARINVRILGCQQQLFE